MDEKYANYFDRNCILKSISTSSNLKPFLEDYIYFRYPTKKVYKENLHPFPNGNFEIYFCLGNSRVLINNGKKEYYVKNFLFCISDLTDRTLFKIETEDAFYSSLIVELKYNSIKYLFDKPLGQYKNKLIDIEELWGKKGNVIKKFLNENNEINIIIPFLNDVFESFFKNRCYKNCKIIPVIEYLKKKEGMLTVKELSDELKISYRSLYRMFVKEIGVSPKDYIKIIRFNKVCNLMSKFPEKDWSELIFTCGYYDQSHFIHDFKDIIKYSPDSFYQLTKGKFYLKRPYFLEL